MAGPLVSFRPPRPLPAPVARGRPARRRASAAGLVSDRGEAGMTWVDRGGRDPERAGMGPSLSRRFPRDRRDIRVPLRVPLGFLIPGGGMAAGHGPMAFGGVLLPGTPGVYPIFRRPVNPTGRARRVTLRPPANDLIP